MQFYRTDLKASPILASIYNNSKFSGEVYFIKTKKLSRTQHIWMKALSRGI
jgi:hypothetical protein